MPIGDKAGRLTNVADHANNSIHFAYNDLGQIVAMADPNMGFREYRRDFAGRIREQVDAKTNRIRFNYNDPLGRLKSREIYSADNQFVGGVTNLYDSNGGDSSYTVMPASFT